MRKSKSKQNFQEGSGNKQVEPSLGIFARFTRKIASLGRNDGASQNEDDLLDYAADLGCFSSSQGQSEGVTFNPVNSDTGGTTNPLQRRSKSKVRSKKTNSNGLTFSDHEVDVTSLEAGRMVVNKQMEFKKSDACSASIHKRRQIRSSNNKNDGYEQ